MEKLYKGPPKNYWYVSYIIISNIYTGFCFLTLIQQNKVQIFFLQKLHLTYNMQGINDFTLEGERIKRVWARLVLSDHFLIFDVHLNSQEFLGSKCKMFFTRSRGFPLATLYYEGPHPPPPPPTGNIKKKITRRKL